MMTQHNGFTLVEVIASLILMAMIGLGIYSFLMTGVEGYLISEGNSIAAGELKPMFDVISTRMSEMKEITCFDTDSQMKFLDTQDSEETVQLVDGTALRIMNWNVLTDLSNTAMTMNEENGNVKDITISFTYTGKSGITRNFDLSFSPRTIMTVSDIPGC